MKFPKAFTVINTFSAYYEIQTSKEIIFLPGTTVQLSDFSFVACSKNNNSLLPTAKIETKYLNNTESILDTIFLYPNPANDYVIVKNLSSVAKILKIYNLTGNIILTKNIEKYPVETVINTKNLTDGLYLFIINNRTFRVVIKK